MRARNGFSLVELSIVLVILGLLVGGILAGQSLIRAAELRAVTSEYSRYSTATFAFRDKYFAVPGDFNNAQAIWGVATDCGGAAANGTCNGTGDGILSNGTASHTGEIFQYWRQLMLAGLIEGTYSGLSGAASGYDAVVGTNVPRSRLSGAGWSIEYLPNYGGDAYNFAYNYGHPLEFGAQAAGGSAANPVLKPEEAWNIDTKMDDGKPSQGRIFARNWGACTNAASFSDTAANYQLSATGLVCSLFFARLF